MGNHGMGTAPGRGGYPPPSSRGRSSYGGQYQQQQQQQQPQLMGYSPGPNSRPPPNQPRGAQGIPPYQQNRTLAPSYPPSSPHQGARSPALASAQPAHPQPGQVPMTNPQMGQHQYGGYPPQFGGYAPSMGPPQVKPQSSSSYAKPAFHKPDQDMGRTATLSTPHSQQAFDLSPSSGIFEQYLTSRNQGQYGTQQGYDPNFMAQQYYQMYGTYPPQVNMPPSSPRPQQMGPGAQQPPYFPGQYGSQPQPIPMSRTSSAISGTDRPTSSMDKSQPGSSTPAANNTVAANRAAGSPAPKAGNFQIPPRRERKSVVIKNPDSGELVTFDKQNAPSPAPPSRSPASALNSTPPPRAPSHTESSHSRNESKSTKTDEEKRNEMRDAIAKKMEADKADEQRKKSEEEAKLAQEKKDVEAKLLREKAEADARQLEAAEAEMRAQKALEKEKADAEAAEGAAAKAKAEADEAAEKARKAKELEDEIARMEAEYAEKERKEAEAEELYQKKMQAKKEEAARKEAEALAMADEDMKRAEREAEEAEEARLNNLEESGESQKERVELFAALQKAQVDTPTTEKTPLDSGAATPASGLPAAPPKTMASGGKQKPVPLKLETSKAVEPAQPSAQLLSLRSARRLMHINDVLYPAPISSPNPALNTAAPMGKFRYDKDFLMQFQRAFTEKPSENWNERVKETVGDTTEPSSARAASARGTATGAGIPMTSGRQTSNRTPLPQMGAFGQGGRTLPPGTTSQSRYEAATANVARNAPPVRPTMQNPLASLVSRGSGGFPTPNASIKMDRTPSATSVAHPNSPRNASQRGGSQRGSRAATRREDPKDNKAMPLTAGGNVKPIEVSATGWKPRSVGANPTGMAGPAPGGDGHLAPDVVQRKVKSNLNKMTPNNFDKISIQILDVSLQSKDETDGRTLRQVIQLTFEKATDEAHWAEMYAQFCKRMLESMSPEIKDRNIVDKKGDVVHGGALFRKYLLNRCQEEFERGWKLNLGDKPEGETEEAAMLSDAYYIEAAAKRRGLGLVRFIGELYKLQMLTERIMHECVKKLVDYEGMPDEAEVESLSNLLKTIGQQLDSTEKGNRMMDAYFMRIGEMIELEGLPSRLKFMLMVSIRNVEIYIFC